MLQEPIPLPVLSHLILRTHSTGEKTEAYNMHSHSSLVIGGAYSGSWICLTVNTTSQTMI